MHGWRAPGQPGAAGPPGPAGRDAKVTCKVKGKKKPKVKCKVKLVSSAKRVHWRLVHEERTVAHGISRVREGKVVLPVSRLATLHPGRYVLRVGGRPAAAFVVPR